MVEQAPMVVDEILRWALWRHGFFMGVACLIFLVAVLCISSIF